MSISDYNKLLSIRSHVDASDSQPTPSISDEQADTSDDEGAFGPMTPADNEGSKAAFIDITERERSYGEPVVTPTSFYAKGGDRDKPYRTYALLLRRKLQEDGQRRYNQLEIRSKFIQKALQKLLVNYSYINLATTPIVIREPYAALFQHREEIREYAKSKTQGPDQKAHMTQLVQFMNVNLAKLEREYQIYAPSSLSTFDLLWAFFRPGTLVVHQTDHFRECRRVITTETKVVEKGRRVFEIWTWSWDYNGISFGPSRSSLRIDEFPGACKLTELEVFPLDLIPDAEAISRTLIERGQKWRECVHLSHRDYCGIFTLPCARYYPV